MFVARWSLGWKTPQEKEMNEIHSDDGSTVEKFGRDPWLQTDWQGLFERVAGSTEPPLQRDTLALAVSNKYGFSQEFGETFVDKAAECGQLFRVQINLDNLTWDYYISEPDVTGDHCNWVSILSSDILADTDELVPEILSRNEVVEKLCARDNQITLNQAQHVADHIECFYPFYADGGDVKMHPQVSKQLVTNRSYAQISEAVSFTTPTGVNEALADVLESVLAYEEATREL